MKILSRILISLLPGLFLLQTHAITPDSLRVSSVPKPLIERFTTDIVYLASDELEGRETGTQGERLAYEYISREFKKAGVPPLAGLGSYLQPFTFNAGSYAGPGNSLKIGKKSFTVNEHFYPLAYAVNAAFKGKAVFVKHGIAAPGRDDYEPGQIIKGRIVVIESGYPADVNPHSKLAAYADLRTRIDSAAARGAAAVIFINSDQSTENPSQKFSNRITPSTLPVLFAKGDAAAHLKLGTNDIIQGRTEILKNEKTGHNVIGYIDNQSESTIVIGAHYDHLGYGTEASLYRGTEILVHNGADDNASGTAGLLELARLLKEAPVKNHNFMFIAFSGEEMGLLGSSYLVKHLSTPVENINCMLNMDMIGRLKPEEPVLLINGAGTSPFWKEAFSRIRVDGLQVKTSESGMGPSDHAAFYLKDIPVLHFFSGIHDDYHKPSDDADKINYEGQAMILEYMMKLIYELDNSEKIVFTKTKDSNNEETPRFKVTLGVIPDYGFDGNGMRIDGVSDDKPAIKAGLKAGDIIIKIGEHQVTDMMGYMKALGRFSKGDKAQVAFLRNGQTQYTEVTF